MRQLFNICEVKHSAVTGKKHCKSTKILRHEPVLSSDVKLVFKIFLPASYLNNRSLPHLDLSYL